MGLISWEDLSKLRIEEPEFFIDPYIIKEGITLLWGKWSTGKSPVTWEMAAAIGRGDNFFGLPSKKGKVLYIDVDSPENLLAARLSKKPVAPNVWFLVLKPLGIPNIPKEVEGELREAQREIHPDVVFLNTLRKLHRMDDKDSVTPVTVYQYFQYMFPQAALVLVHHNKKKPGDPRIAEVDGENFSGSQHWMDDAQAGLYLEKYRDPKKRFNLKLHHKKSQGTRTIKPLPLLLDKEGGSKLTSPLYDDMVKVYTIVHEAKTAELGAETDEKIMAAIGCSKSTAWRRKQSILKGHFPTSRHWMDLDEDDEEEEER